ncbi:MAG: hypothetical protein ABGY41_03070, partial [Candidatus Poribacteria bacterium]
RLSVALTAGSTATRTEDSQPYNRPHALCVTLRNHWRGRAGERRSRWSRWAGGGQENVDLDFDYAGQTALSVEAQDKLATTWSRLKTTR